MSLTLSMLRCPDAVPPETRQVSGGEFSIGRGPDNDWVLADPDRHLSKRHCVIAFRAGGWQIADTSTNGTFLNRDADPVGGGAVRDLRDGDRLRLGAYEIEVRIAETAGMGGGFGGGFGTPATGPAGRGAVHDPFGDDPFGQPVTSSRGTSPTGLGFGDDPLLGGDQVPGLGAPSINLPADFDPLAPEPGDAPFTGPTQADHTPSFSDAFRPPPPPATALPDDWDFGRAVPMAPAAAPSPAPAPPAALPPTASAFAPPPTLVPASLPADPLAGSAPMPPPSSPFAEPAIASPFAEAPPVVPVPSPVVAPPVTPPAGPSPQRAASSDLLDAFLRGAGMEDVRPADPAAAMAALGATFRAMVGGLRQVLIARAAIKGEFRIEQTMIRARGNNPLKFSAGDDDALAALLGAGRRTDMAAAEAVADALRDIRLHELASMAATQAAARALLARLDPAALRAAAEQGGGLSLMPAQKKARAWDAFEKLHASVTQALADDFDSVFGKAFARAYEQAMDEAAAKEKTG
ncbi:MAG TPA: type VI secretion system-associated FHA domain protein TagH [Acetobacteraceae bacterium]|nr:type VI secretion system-associated FHA domain protein TagH [Acetobacteraceae bacterium]